MSDWQPTPTPTSNMGGLVVITETCSNRSHHPTQEATSGGGHWNWRHVRFPSGWYASYWNAFSCTRFSMTKSVHCETKSRLLALLTPQEPSCQRGQQWQKETCRMTLWQLYSLKDGDTRLQKVIFFVCHKCQNFNCFECSLQLIEKIHMETQIRMQEHRVKGII